MAKIRKKLKEDKLRKVYNPKISKFRVKWVKLFRPISKKFRVHPATIIVLLGFIGTIILNVVNPYNTLAFIPFLGAWVFVLVSLYYFRLFPLTWLEMDDIEKDVFRKLHMLPSDWEIDNK